jgi:hypothetical protein
MCTRKLMHIVRSSLLNVYERLSPENNDYGREISYACSVLITFLKIFCDFKVIHGLQMLVTSVICGVIGGKACCNGVQCVDTVSSK